jgi:tetratricopeptide (TPR) repeat protein/transcriptional regulator with XRE-family HTH domain
MEVFAKRIKREREHYAWSQEQVAEMIGTTAPNVSRWERGRTLPNLHFRQKLCELFGKNAEELGLLGNDTSGEQHSSSLDQQVLPSPPTITSQVWHIPHSRNLLFTGREDLLLQIRAAVTTTSQPIAVSQPQAISGLGGIGKTQLVIEYAYRYRALYDVILWIRADSPDLLVSDFLLAAELLRLPERQEPDQRVVINAVKRWFSTHERWLLILDNADQVEEVSSFFPSTDKGHILLTTRTHAIGTAAQRIVVGKMTREESCLFLLRRARIVEGNVGLAQIREPIRLQALSIIDEVDGLPLALDQAGAYIEETCCSLSDYLVFYQMSQERLLWMRGQEVTGHSESVMTTWSLSFEKIEQRSPVAAALLRLCALLHPDAIPETMLEEGASELGPILQTTVGHRLILNEAIGELLRYSLLQRDAETKTLTIHRLLQKVLRSTMNQEEYTELVERVVKMVNKVFPIMLDSISWMSYEIYLPHARICKILVDQIGTPLLEAAQLFAKTGVYLTRRARYAEAAPLLEYALSIYEPMRDSRLLETIECMGYLGWLYQEEGKYEEAESLYQRALAIAESDLGSEHSGTALALHYLAGLYQEQGRYQEARPLMEQSLAIREMVLGSHHLDTADSMSYLGWLNEAEGKSEEAERLYRRVVEIRETALGSDSIFTAISFNNLAKTCEKQGRYEEAEALYQRALAIYETALSPEHPYVATSLNNLAKIYQEQRKYEEAEALSQRALAIRETALGPEHPETAESYQMQALFFQMQGRDAEAEALSRRVLAIREKVLGHTHPDTVASRESYLLLLRTTGREAEAARLAQPS